MGFLKRDTRAIPRGLIRGYWFVPPPLEFIASFDLDNDELEVFDALDASSSQGITQRLQRVAVDSEEGIIGERDGFYVIRAAR
jgi:hypothetical protein